MDDEELLARIRAGDEAAFNALVARYGPLMLRIALSHTPSRAVAEEVVQEAWLGVVQGLPKFEGRSSLKTWILRIVANRARTRGERERRSVPFGDDRPVVDPSRFTPEGAWGVPPTEWPEDRLLQAETLERVNAAIDRLPPRQQEVLVLRDVEGWQPAEVGEALNLTDGNQRVLLHRARAKVREELERYFQEAA
ncbi:sigma-70 family RNA polymerase sigma factor [Solirubrobacter sp. CPCC 204708]|uniref:Sigma-70 family RNA polymerase sigma factor n=1 Tax=Solirubrobacter deserti TaxID=2282478 RepID=A0ABT4RRN3_9ACTN|nr:sigma-70 family RNA polymerase sigma factor [Solirubrobacter deserti]MBE2320680.1 sigma-70 family RNA polymerase sigma factor [Solirubrobacter deserti]MDA0140905.1 sigma-70 family RNA polymerase sigma factor [Solirubrobacter deserti]